MDASRRNFLTPDAENARPSHQQLIRRQPDQNPACHFSSPSLLARNPSKPSLSRCKMPQKSKKQTVLNQQKIERKNSKKACQPAKFFFFSVLNKTAGEIRPSGLPCGMSQFGYDLALGESKFLFPVGYGERAGTSRLFTPAVLFIDPKLSNRLLHLIQERPFYEPIKQPN